jgi:transcription elongation factor Elf1
MSVHTFRTNHIWKKVAGNHEKKNYICPRCKNKVNYILCVDSDSLWSVIKYNRIYAYTCPICPNYDEISEQHAKAIIKEG